jgi:hypothetical protein
MASSATLFDVEAALDAFKRRSGEAETEVLSTCVDTAFKELASEPFARFENLVLRRVFDLLLSQDPREKLGGLHAMDSLIEAPSGSQEVDCPIPTIQLPLYVLN